MSISFAETRSKAANPGKVIDVDLAANAVATTNPAANAALAVRRPEDDALAEYTSKDLQESKSIRLVSGKSQLVEDNPDWRDTFVYDKAVSLGKEIVAIALQIPRKFYEEDTPFGEAKERWWTAAEAAASGKNANEAAICDLLIEIPEALLANPTVEAEAYTLLGKKYIRAQYWTRTTQYKGVACIFVKALGKHLAGKTLPDGLWRVVSSKRNGSFGAFTTAEAKPHGLVPEDLRQAIREKFNV